MINNIENVKANVVAAVSVTEHIGKGELRDEPVVGSGMIVFRVDESSRPDYAKWIAAFSKQEGFREIPIAIDLRRWYKKKSKDQLALFWPLVKILVLESEGKYDEVLKERYYHGLLEQYAPRGTYLKHDGTEGEYIKTCSEMTTLQMSRMIEGVFRELAEFDLSFEDSSTRIKNYFLEWRQWRSELKRDELNETYLDIEDYRLRVPYCEATGARLGPGMGHIAHIVSRGAGGVNEAWNWLHLSPEAHLMTQHQKGWVEMLTQYPHLMTKVNEARMRSGKKELVKPDDLYDDFIEEMEDGEEFKESEDQELLDIF